MKDLKKLLIWEKGRVPVKNTYLLLESIPRPERFVFTQQIQRTAISLPAKIVKGAGKTANAEFAGFIDIASGSTCELETQLMIAVKN